MSIDLVFRARDILVLANGLRKKTAIGKSLLEEATDRMPLSYAQISADRGGNVTFVVDEAAGQDLLNARNRMADRGIELEDRRP
jgi:6-phosphogluconolactonase/glucosamine-6-phosphate isomerase/deaminase